jgi:phosphatidylglycerophosphate synthase
VSGGTREPGHPAGPSPVSRAVVVASRAACLTLVGGLPLAVRAVLTLRAAGFAVSVVAGPQAGELSAWLRRRGIPEAAPVPSRGPAPVLVLMGDVVFEARVLAPLLAAAEPGRVRVAQSPDVAPGDVRAGLCPESALPALEASLSNGECSLGAALEALGHRDEPVRLGDGLFLALDTRSTPATLTEALLDHLGRRAAATDGYLATLLDRPLSRRLTAWLLPWPVTPNQITVVSIAVGLVGAVGLATVSYPGRLGGVLLLLVSSVLDGVDGEVARARFEQSPAGARLDLLGDYVIHLATFAGLAVGLARQGPPPLLLIAAGVLFAGVVAASVAMHRLVNGPVLARSDDLHDGDATAGLRGTPIVTHIEKLAGRDYVYLLLLFAVVGRLDWFVAAAALGSWAFVIGLIAYQVHQRPGSLERAHTAEDRSVPRSAGRR